MKRTKIVATVGPASDSPELLEKMIDAGVNVFRFNLKHSELDWHKERVQRVREIAAKKEIVIGTLFDLQGPEVRIETSLGQTISVPEGDELRFALEFGDDNKTVRIPTPEVFTALQKGDFLLIDDGKHVFEVTRVGKHELTAVAVKDAEVENRKSLNMPGVFLDLSPLNEKDVAAIEVASELQIPWLALSFVRSAEDILALRAEMKKHDYAPGIIAKIENKQALDNLDDIINAADAVMIARGDLGIENPIEEIAYWQKTIITKCRELAKPVITATQMLESMTNNPLPTRAEATDVANAVFDATDAVMLSGETAMGTYPVETVQTMVRIIEFTESKDLVPEVEITREQSQTGVITHAAFDILHGPKDFTIDAMVIFTETGRTANNLARYRPRTPIAAVTSTELVCEQLTLTYGIEPLTKQAEHPEEEISTLDPALEELKSRGILKPGHRVMFTHGNVWSVPGLTNTIVIKEIV